MPATSALSPAAVSEQNLARTAKIRARCAAASPRITRRELADEAGLAEGTVKNVLSDNAPWGVAETLRRIEVALDLIEGRRASNGTAEGADAEHEAAGMESSSDTGAA